MNLRNYLDKLRPNFEKGGKLHAFKSVYDGLTHFCMSLMRHQNVVHPFMTLLIQNES